MVMKRGNIKNAKIYIGRSATVYWNLLFCIHSRISCSVWSYNVFLLDNFVGRQYYKQRCGSGVPIEKPIALTYVYRGYKKKMVQRGRFGIRVYWNIAQSVDGWSHSKCSQHYKHVFVFIHILSNGPLSAEIMKQGIICSIKIDQT